MMNQPNHNRRVGDYIVTNIRLGTGAYGEVYRGYKEQNPKEVVAVKQIPYDKNKSDELSFMKRFYKYLQRELEILQKVSNTHIVKFYKSVKTTSAFYIFLEFCNEGDLRKVIRGRKYLPEAEVFTYLCHFLEGYSNLYKLNIYHRDIKPENILIHNGLAKISDFGFARAVRESRLHLILTPLGTPAYMSPQILQEELYSSKCDVFSLGVTLYELLYGGYPWPIQEGPIQKTISKLIEMYENVPLKFPEQPQRSPQLINLLKQMLAIDEESRIGWQELFQAPYVKLQNHFDLLQNKEVQIPTMAIEELYISQARVLTHSNNLFLQSKVLKLPIKYTSNKDSDVIDYKSIQASYLQNSIDQPIVVLQTPNLKFEQKINLQSNQDEITTCQQQIAQQDFELHQNDISKKLNSFIHFQRNIALFIKLTAKKLNMLDVTSTQQKQNLRVFILEKEMMNRYQNLIKIMNAKV